MKDNRLIDISGLEVIYKTSEETVRAVNGVDLHIGKGETLGLVGETGAGKTTIALSILKLLPPRVGKVTGGSILFDDIDITQAGDGQMREIRGERISMIFQDPMTSLNPIRTVGSQIGEVIHLHNKDLNKEQVADRVAEIFEMVGIPPSRSTDYPHQFSGGMKQRIVIAIALACEPQLLLADEPTTALDVTIQAQVLQLMKGLKEKLGTSMLLITHDLGVIAQTCDRVAIIYAGEIVEIGTARDIFKGERHHPYTAGLFGSLPNMSQDSERLNPIPGLMPDPTDLPEGCKFHIRCGHCTDICRTQQPPVVTEGTHKIQCHLYSHSGEGERHE